LLDQVTKCKYDMGTMGNVVITDSTLWKSLVRLWSNVVRFEFIYIGDG